MTLESILVQSDNGALFGEVLEQAVVKSPYRSESALRLKACNGLITTVVPFQKRK
jgi:hypothetical protein